MIPIIRVFVRIIFYKTQPELLPIDIDYLSIGWTKYAVVQLIIVGTRGQEGKSSLLLLCAIPVRTLSSSWGATKREDLCKHWTPPESARHDGIKHRTTNRTSKTAPYYAQYIVYSKTGSRRAFFEIWQNLEFSDYRFTQHWNFGVKGFPTTHSSRLYIYVYFLCTIQFFATDQYRRFGIFMFTRFKWRTHETQIIRTSF